MKLPAVRRCAAALGLLLLTLGAPASAQSRDSVAVRTAMTGFLAALNEFDVPRMSADFADDITAFVPSAQVDRVEGKVAVTAIFSAFAVRGKAAPRATSVPDDMRIEVSGSLAIVHFMVHDAPPKPTRRRTFIWRKVGKKWLISHFHASDNVPPAK
ncbi:MAG: nuclear transport factor 2 family protein [Gemmatimonadaceae bacterium]